MKVCWAEQAIQDRQEIWELISNDDILAAIDMDSLFSEVAAKLGDYPMLGHDGRVPNTRELVLHDSYRMIYQVHPRESTIWILAVVHTARLWPRLR